MVGAPEANDSSKIGFQGAPANRGYPELLTAFSKFSQTGKRIVAFGGQGLFEAYSDDGMRSLVAQVGNRGPK
jgi:hypothetical protein